MADRMSRLATGLLLLWQISLLCLFICCLIVFPVSSIFIALEQGKQESTQMTLDKVHVRSFLKTIVMKPADNIGRAIVIVNKEDCIKETKRQLHDEQHYTKLLQGSSDVLKKILKCLQSHSLKLIKIK